MTFVTTHPIQYQVPVFRHLASRDDMSFRVLFAMLPDAPAQGAGFGVRFQWDIPLLDGYEFSTLKNVSASPGVTHFRGCDTPGIGDELKRLSTDAVVVNGWVVKSCLQTLSACRRHHIPCIVRGEANNLKPRPWWKRMLQRQLVNRFDAYLPIGTANREFYSSHGIHDDLMFDAPYCVENDRFQRAAEEAADRVPVIRERWGVPVDTLCFLYCGKFEEKKHPVELLQSVRQAVAKGARLHLLMVGDGVLKQECEMIVRQQQLPVTFSGFLNQSEIVDAYVASDVLVLPSDHGETWGLVVNEAMACGLPALVSDQVGCATDLIVENETGWVFPFGNWDHLANQLLELSARPNELHPMRDHCRQLIQHYSPAVAAEGIAAAVQRVAHSI